MFRMNRSISVSVAVTTFVINWLLFWKGAEYFGFREPSFIATLIMGALLIHELGHWLMFEINGVKAHIFFAIILGGAVPASDSIVRFKRLRWSQRAAIYLAGVVGNLLMVIGALALYGAGFLSERHLEQVANLNGILIALNLLPAGMLDGGRFTNLLFDSISENRDWRFAMTIGAAIGITLLVASLTSDTSWIGTNFMLYVGLVVKAKNDDPRGSFHRLAMTRRQQRWFTMVYVLLFVSGVLLSSWTPSWKL